MRRIILVYNPRSSRFADVRHDVLPKIRKIKGYLIGKYEVKPTNINQNISNLAKIIQDDDIVISSGGDATGVIAANAIMKSDKSATLAALPYGNFNDLARTLRTKTIDDIFNKKRTTKKTPNNHPEILHNKRNSQIESKTTNPAPHAYYPLEVLIDGKHWRYATCYVTIGMTAEVVDIYDSQEMRLRLKNGFGRIIISYTALASWYFKNRRKHAFIPEFTLNGDKQQPKTSDYIALNGHYMARIMRGGHDYSKPKVFLHTTDRLATSFPRLIRFMIRSIFHQTPGNATTGDVIEFTNPAAITIQAEGESEHLEGIKRIEIRKAHKYIRVIQN